LDPGLEPDLDPGGQLIMDPPDLDPFSEHLKQAYVNLKQDVKLFYLGSGVENQKKKLCDLKSKH
jgi:hypothetical protein